MCDINDDCVLQKDERFDTWEEQKKDCPLIEVPKPHGDLIDRDALNIGEYEREDDDTGTLEISLGGLLDLYHKMKNAPTVIEAEGSEDDADN
jgi:hypothetical protein